MGASARRRGEDGGHHEGPSRDTADAGGTLENAQAMAAHESPKTTTLYDRTGGAITLDEVERIRMEGTESTTAASHAVCSCLGRVFCGPDDLRRVCTQPLSPPPSL
jgi:hypothetical protein